MNYEAEDDAPVVRRRGDDLVARVEAFYLGALRILLLLIATLLILYAAWLGASGLYGVMRDEASVEEPPAVVTAAEVAALPVATAEDGAPAVSGKPFSTETQFYSGLVDRYHRLFVQKFEPFRQPGDVRISRAAFDARYVKSGERLAAVKDGELSFSQDRDDLTLLVKTMGEVSALPDTIKRLNRYKSAKKSRVSRVVSGVRQERYCSYYGYYIGTCISYDTRDVPYRRTVVETRLPDGVLGPRDLFQAYQDRHTDLLTSRRRTNSEQANTERAEIRDGNITGGARIWTGIQMAAGFLLIMFLFLLIAIERHQRRMAAATLGLEDDMMR